MEELDSERKDIDRWDMVAYVGLEHNLYPQALVTTPVAHSVSCHISFPPLALHVFHLKAVRDTFRCLPQSSHVLIFLNVINRLM